MSNDTMPPNVDERPEQEKGGQADAKQEGQQVQQRQASAAHQPSQRSAPGRRPLFRS